MEELSQKVEKSKETKKKPGRTKKTILSEDQITKLKNSQASSDEIFQQVSASDPEFSRVLGSKPIANENLKDMLVDSMLRGESLREAAVKIRDARVNGTLPAES